MMGPLHIFGRDTQLQYQYQVLGSALLQCRHTSWFSVGAVLNEANDVFDPKPVGLPRLQAIYADTAHPLPRIPCI